MRGSRGVCVYAGVNALHALSRNDKTAPPGRGGGRAGCRSEDMTEEGSTHQLRPSFNERFKAPAVKVRQRRWARACTALTPAGSSSYTVLEHCALFAREPSPIRCLRPGPPRLGPFRASRRQELLGGWRGAVVKGDIGRD